MSATSIVTPEFAIGGELGKSRHEILQSALAAKVLASVLWSPSYVAASCGGAPISIVRQYIEHQKTPD